MDERYSDWHDPRQGAYQRQGGYQYGEQGSGYRAPAYQQPTIDYRQPPTNYRTQSGVQPGYQQAAGSVVINSPTTYEDVQRLIDHLRCREQVIVDFSKVNQQSVYRILDFMSGAIYALGGSIQPIHRNIFLFAPAGVTITIPPQFNRK